jgi:GLPGLI family protein
MKHLFLTSILSLFTILIQAQDSIPIGRVVYLQQADMLGDEPKNGVATLLFNRSVSLYTHNSAPTQDSSFNDPQYDMPSTVAGDREGFPIYKIYAERRLYAKIFCRQAPRTNCVVSDTFATTAWTLHPEHRRFGQYDCRRATGHYRGRDYEAWYTLDVPIPTGPFKLGGLPGLILEATSLDGKVKFLFKSIKISDQVAGVIRMPTGKDVGMTYSQYIEDQDIFHRNQIDAAKAKGFELSITRSETIELNTEN